MAKFTRVVTKDQVRMEEPLSSVRTIITYDMLKKLSQRLSGHDQGMWIQEVEASDTGDIVIEKKLGKYSQWSMQWVTRRPYDQRVFHPHYSLDELEKDKNLPLPFCNWIYEVNADMIRIVRPRTFYNAHFGILSVDRIRVESEEFCLILKKLGIL